MNFCFSKPKSIEIVVKVSNNRTFLNRNEATRQLEPDTRFAASVKTSHVLDTNDERRSENITDKTKQYYNVIKHNRLHYIVIKHNYIVTKNNVLSLHC